MASNNTIGYENRLRTADLKVDQVLVEVRHGHWSNPTHTEGRWVVDKILKTRVAITLLREVEGAWVRSMVSERMLVRDGFVQKTMEGYSWRDGMNLYTEDDPHLPEVRATTERSRIRLAATQAAENAHRRLEQGTAEKAVAALQAYLDSIKDLGEGEE